MKLLFTALLGRAMESRGPRASVALDGALHVTFMPALLLDCLCHQKSAAFMQGPLLCFLRGDCLVRSLLEGESPMRTAPVNLTASQSQLSCFVFSYTCSHGMSCVNLLCFWQDLQFHFFSTAFD